MEYEHASFLKNIEGIPKHWFVYKSSMFGKNRRFVNFKDGHKDLVISPLYSEGDSSYNKNNNVVHVIYGGEGLKVFKSEAQALSFAKQYMRTH